MWECEMKSRDAQGLTFWFESKVGKHEVWQGWLVEVPSRVMAVSLFRYVEHRGDRVS